MNIKYYKPYTSTTRHKTSLNNFLLTKIKPEKSLINYNHRLKGRNNQGKITIRHRGGGHKRQYRIIDFKRNKYYIKGIVKTIEYDPNRNANIALIFYQDGEKRYILHPEHLKINDCIYAGKFISISIGNSLPLKNIPLGSEIHNIELIPGKGGQLIRAAGTFAKILAKKKNYVIIRLASKEIRLINSECCATLGKLSNFSYNKIISGKAGRTRWLGIRPTVRGSAMNPIDHPHGGGEGKASIGKPQPRTPWGKIAFGVKTRKRKKSDCFILHLY